MARNGDRLVRRIERRLLSAEMVGRSCRPTPSEQAELVARIDRLHALGDRFSQVGLSRYVVHGPSTVVPTHFGGGCVATEV